MKVFGFHLAPVDLRQNSDVHERVVAELLEVARPGSAYSALDEEARCALLLEELELPAGEGASYAERYDLEGCTRPDFFEQFDAALEVRPAAVISSRMTFSILARTRSPSGSHAKTPGAWRRMYPARTSSLWLVASASEGSSLRVRTKS